MRTDTSPPRATSMLEVSACAVMDSVRMAGGGTQGTGASCGAEGIRRIVLRDTLLEVGCWTWGMIVIWGVDFSFSFSVEGEKSFCKKERRFFGDLVLG